MQKKQQQQARRQAKGLQQAHMRDCYITAVRNKRKEAAKQIKQKMSREHKKRNWWYLQKTVKDLPPSPLLCVETKEDDSIR